MSQVSQMNQVNQVNQVSQVTEVSHFQGAALALPSDAKAPLSNEHRGTPAVQRMVEFAPSTGALALWMRHLDCQEVEPDEPQLTTDGQALFYAVSFERLPLAEQTGRVANGVLHVALRHPQRFLDLQQHAGEADLQLYTICADAIVNSALGHLGWLSLPAKSIGLSALLASALDIHQTDEVALLQWDVERLYRAIDDRGKQGGRRTDGPRASRARRVGAGTPMLLQPDPSTPRPESEADTAQQWRERLLRAHASDGEFSLLRTLLADLPVSHTPWPQVLRTYLAHALSARPALSWSRPARSILAQGRVRRGRRLPWEPGTTASGNALRLAVVVDVSGSIEEDLMARFAREIAAISRRQEAAMVVVIGDDRVRRVVHLEPGCLSPQQLSFDGGGGTDFTPLLQEADMHRPDVAVVLTDLQGPAGFRPRWPVIWAVPDAPAGLVVPFGRLLSLR